MSHLSELSGVISDCSGVPERSTKLQNQAFCAPRLCPPPFSTVHAKGKPKPNLLGIKAGITNAPPLPVGEFRRLYEVMVHLSLLVIVHGSGIQGKLCRTTVKRLNSQHTFANVVI